MKTSENQRFPDLLQWYEKGTLGRNGLSNLKRLLSFSGLSHALPLKLPNIYFFNKRS